MVCGSAWPLVYDAPNSVSLYLLAVGKHNITPHMKLLIAELFLKIYYQCLNISHQFGGWPKNPFLMENRDLIILHSQAHGCCWPGDARSRGPSSFGIDLVFQVYSGLSLKSVMMKTFGVRVLIPSQTTFKVGERPMSTRHVTCHLSFIEIATSVAMGHLSI